MFANPLFDLGPFTDTAKAMSPARLKIVQALAEFGPMMRGQIVKQTGLPRNTVNHELAHLTGRGHTDLDAPFVGAVLVEETKAGLEFRLNPSWKLP